MQPDLIDTPRFEGTSVIGVKWSEDKFARFLSLMAGKLYPGSLMIEMQGSELVPSDKRCP
jgi:hypothetical protein